MSKYIKLVQGDTGPQIKVTLTDEVTDAPINLTGAGVVMHFRELDTVNLLATLPGSVFNAIQGVVVFEWEEGTLDIPEGTYQGEIEVTFQSGLHQSVFLPLTFVLREQFA